MVHVLIIREERKKMRLTSRPPRAKPAALVVYTKSTRERKRERKRKRKKERRQSALVVVVVRLSAHCIDIEWHRAFTMSLAKMYLVICPVVSNLFSLRSTYMAAVLYIPDPLCEIVRGRITTERWW